MMKHAVCNVYYSKITKEDMTSYELRQYQKNLAMDMLRQGFSDFFSIELDAEKIKRAEYGKPYYQGQEGYCFNISHCKTGVAVAVSHVPVGVDIEGMRSVSAKVIKRTCTRKEIGYILNGNKLKEELIYEEKRRFLELWTLKESYVKMTGEGLTIPIDTISFDRESFQTMGRFLVGTMEESKDSTSLLMLNENLIISLSIECNGFKENSIECIEYRKTMD